MKMIRLSLLTALVTLVGMGACDHAPLSPPDPSWFVASVDGAATADYQGTGWFSIWNGPTPRPFLGFHLHSRGLGGASNQSFSIRSPERDLPAAGTYTLGRLDADGGFVASYSIVKGSIMEEYRATEGTLELTQVSGATVDGTFRFTGVLSQICSAPTPGAMWCQGVGLDPDAPTLTVEGSFHAVHTVRGRGLW